MSQVETILVTGGAGYVGAVLVPKLLRKGYLVKVLDLFIYGEDVLDSVKDHRNLQVIKGDLRDQRLLLSTVRECDALIHLACISNDPSFELDPQLGKSINYDAFIPLVEVAKNSKVNRFIYASSSSVYGVKEEENVTEDLPLEPLTDYSRYKAKCETVLLDAATDDFTVTVLRPSTVCGYSPRQRLDLTVNILTNHAINKGQITVFGGEQKRPNIHIEDITDFYVSLLDQPDHMIQKKIYNVGYENLTVNEIAALVKQTIGGNIPIITTPSNDVRSYHISSEKIKKELGFTAKRTIESAVNDLFSAFSTRKLINPLTNIRYYNIKTMQASSLK